MAENIQDRAGVIAPPPLIYLGPLALGLLLNRWRPRPFLPPPVARSLGTMLAGSGLLLGGWAARTMLAAGTALDPEHPVTRIVTAGPYRFSRNPIYLAFTLIYLGIAALANTRWPVLFLPGVLATVRRGVIAREERYLARKFGGEYTGYQTRVRRWI
jgi:protein-S-isoprenylcysteine O-methyltransferase Ste14